MRSSRAASILRDAGFTQVYDLGGMGNGAAVGLSVEGPPGDTPGD
ncbi:MAG: rhodanese-like domain-containing protein [Planctomycetota bacterium]|nr:MAG: rhodanese-like domain-containing protein [Planctomycetota bacterium]